MCDPALVVFFSFMKLSRCFVLFYWISNVLSPIVMNACRTKNCRRHGDDGGYDDARRGILKAFSCCKAYFILILMQK